MEAVKLLHELELENRLATPQEQEILSRYVGWGGLSQAFEEGNNQWAGNLRNYIQNCLQKNTGRRGLLP